jgi:cytochrome c biogenesis protein CcmG/thiol:disulfide interchange protein DsbE
MPRPAIPVSRRARPLAILGLVVILALAAWAVRSGSGCASPEPTGIAAAEPGQAAPALIGSTLAGAPFDLSTYRGKPVIVNFWASWCVPCQAEFPLFQSALASHAADGLTMVGVIYQDTPGAAQAFAQGHGASWLDVTDPCGSIATAYTVVAPPQTYFIDGSGLLKSRQIGQLTQADLDRQLAAILP